MAAGGDDLLTAHLNPRSPPMDDAPPGVSMRVTVERVGGVGPWAD
jgi:hypothetical protein